MDRANGSPAGEGGASEASRAGTRGQYTALTPEQADALDDARLLAAHGVPVFVAYPDPTKSTGYALPKGWEQTKAEPRYVDAWRPGMALCAVMGQGLDLVDRDEQNGGARDALAAALPTVYMLAASPSGGEHYFVRSLGLRSRDGFIPGWDYKGGGADGHGRGFAFIAPTERVSKTTGEVRPYRITRRPVAAELEALGTDTTGRKLATIIQAARKDQRTAERVTSPDGDRITEHTRNATLASLAGSMRRRGMTEAALEAALLAENASRCDPPLDESEVLGIARSVSRYEPADVGVDRPLTDAGQAELFADLNAGRLRYLHPLSEWRIFDQTQHRYRRDVDGEVDRLALEAARHRLKLAADIPDKDARAAAVKFALGNESQQRLEAVKRLARSTPPLADAGVGWDADPYQLGTPSGVLDLRTGSLRDGHPADLISMHAGAAYEPDAECPRWTQFLSEVFVDPAVIDYFQRWVGYCLSGDMSAQVFVLMHGRGANGKSVLLNVLRRVLGDYALNMPFSTFELRSERSALSPDMALLPGKRLVTSSETNDATRTNEARIKALTGADPITARPLYGRPFTFQPVAKLMFAVNVLPDVHDDSEAFWRRAHVLRFERQFLGAQMDPHLEEKLIEELPGILAWAVRGAIDYLDGGLRAPDQVLIGALEWRQAADPLAEFFATRCVIQDGAIARADGLYTAYKAWCAANGIADRDRMTGTRFGNAAGTRFTKKRDRLGTYYEGVGIRDDHHVDPPPVTGWSASNRGDGAPGPAQHTSTHHGVTGSLNLGDGLEGTSDNFPSEMPREGELSGNPSNPSHPSHFAGRRIERWEP